MIHYNFLKLTQAADAEAVLARCREVYAELEAELDFLHDAKVSRCITVRDSNADIMMVMRLDGAAFGLSPASEACRAGAELEGRCRGQNVV